MSSISFLRSSNSSAFFFAALDFAVDLDAFAAAFLERLAVAERVEDFFRDRVVSFEVFVAMRRTVTQLRVDCEGSLLSIDHCRDEMF